MRLLILFLIFIGLVSCTSKQGGTLSTEKIQEPGTIAARVDTCVKYDLTEFLRTDGDHGTDGVFDTMYQRIQFHFASIKRSDGDNCIYIISGFDRLKGLVTPFQGEISIDRIVTRKGNFYEPDIPDEDKLVDFSGTFLFREDSSVNGSGVFHGDVNFGLSLNKHGQLSDDMVDYMGDGFSNFIYDGAWTSYKTGKVKQCIWGQGKLPNTGDFQVGDGEQYANRKYAKNGWEYKENRELVDNPVGWWIGK